ncbi:MAG: CHAT domain-containing protein [Saprospiraceae bacterium]
MEWQDVTVAKHFNNLYSEEGRGADLYELVWKPLDEYFSNKGIQHIYYAPAGLLYKMNIQAIPRPDGQYMGKYYRMVALGSCRQIIHQDVPITENKRAFVMGIDFGEGEYQTFTERDGNSIEKSVVFRNTSAPNRNQPWQSLEWTEAEVILAEEALKDADYDTKLLMGKDATEQVFKQQGTKAASHGVMHVASHGYFFSAHQERHSEQGIFSSSHNPLIRSGLILANANEAWINGSSAYTNGEDGVLTAYEVSLMDFSDTHLVILSACESGLGDIRGHEKGVYGLRRAFKLAGVKYLIMTMWTVDDFHSKFMRLFYENWLDKKWMFQPLFTTQAIMQETYQNPYWWAGFQLFE